MDKLREGMWQMGCLLGTQSRRSDQKARSCVNQARAFAFG